MGRKFSWPLQTVRKSKRSNYFMGYDQVRYSWRHVWNNSTEIRHCPRIPSDFIGFYGDRMSSRMYFTTYVFRDVAVSIILCSVTKLPEAAPLFQPAFPAGALKTPMLSLLTSTSPLEFKRLSFSWWQNFREYELLLLLLTSFVDLFAIPLCSFTSLQPL